MLENKLPPRQEANSVRNICLFELKFCTVVVFIEPNKFGVVGHILCILQIRHSLKIRSVHNIYPSELIFKIKVSKLTVKVKCFVLYNDTRRATIVITALFHTDTKRIDVFYAKEWLVWVSWNSYQAITKGISLPHSFSRLIRNSISCSSTRDYPI